MLWVWPPGATPDSLAGCQHARPGNGDSREKQCVTLVWWETEEGRGHDLICCIHSPHQTTGVRHLHPVDFVTL